MRLNLSGIFSILLLSTMAQAKTYHYVYIYNGDKLQYRVEAKTTEEAFSKGADFCYDFFIQAYPKADRIDVIDSCANPLEKIK